MLLWRSHDIFLKIGLLFHLKNGHVNININIKVHFLCCLKMMVNDEVKKVK